MTTNGINLSEFAPKTTFRYRPVKAGLKNSTIAPISIDIGYSSTKVYSETGEHVFPSFPVKVVEDKTIFEHETNIKYRDERGRIWYVGDLAQNVLESGRDLLTDENLYGRSRINSAEYLVLLRVALFLGLSEEGFDLPAGKAPVVKTGLPEEYMASDRSILRKRFVGHHHFDIKIGHHPWTTVSLDIKDDDISIISQPFGSLWAMAANQQGEIINNDILDSESVLIFDAGMHTTDLFYMKTGTKGTSITWNNLAMHEIFRRVTRDIFKGTNEERDIKVYELFRFIKEKNNFKIPYGNRQEYDCRDDFARNTRDVAQELIDQLRVTYNKLLDIDILICTGGLGKVMYPFFKEAFPCQVILSEVTDRKEEENYSTVLANAVGFFNCLIAELKATEPEEPEKEPDKKSSKKGKQDVINDEETATS